MIRVGRKGEPGAQYIGRGSPLGNPFPISGTNTRDVVCDKYMRWFTVQVSEKNPVVMAELARLEALARAGDLVLGCFCSPQRCHGDTIRRYLNDRLNYPA